MKIKFFICLFFIYTINFLSIVNAQNENIDTTCISLTDDLVKTMELINKDVFAFNIANSENDNCYLALLDTLASKFIITSNAEYMICLELISTVRDGYLAEYFPVIGQKLYHGNFMGFFNYIYKRKDALFNTMADVFSESIAYENYFEKNEKKLNDYFESQIRVNKFNEEQNKYFGFLKQKSNEYLKRLN